MLSSLAELDAVIPWFFPLMAVAFGACIGSFLNVVIYRVPAEKSIVLPGSHCACGQPIKGYDNIPVLSWLLLRGHARCCGRPISARYPFVEVLTALLFLACWMQFYPAIGVVFCGWVFISALICATFIDFDHMIIPDVFTLGLGVCGVGLAFLVPVLHGQPAELPGSALRSATVALQGLLIGSGFLLWFALLAEVILKKEAMGFGDVKFVGAIGAFCGWQGALFSVFGGAIVGTLWFALAWSWQKMSGKSAQPALPAEKPVEEAASEAPFSGMWDAAALGAGVLGVLASLVYPALHARRSDFLLLDGIRSGTDAVQGLLVGSGLLLWLSLILHKLLRKDVIPFNVVLFAGAIGAGSNWRGGAPGFGQGLLLALAGGALAAFAWRWLDKIQSRRPAPAVAEAIAEDLPNDEPAALGFGVHIPFGPMLAIAGGLYFLFLRPFADVWLAEFSTLF